MNTRTLQKLAVLDKKIANIFGGVFASDMIPEEKVLKQTVYIINKDPHDQPGTHWVCLYINPNTTDCIYYDSYGEKPNNSDIDTFLAMNANNVEYNTQKLQAFCSNVCGCYCLHFCYHIARGHSLNNIIKNFDRRTPSMNDKKVARFVRTVFKHTFAEIRTDFECSNQQTSLPISKYRF